jgi:hypothetical protein
MNRVTRLGQFSPLGQVFNMESFVDNYKSAANFLYINFDKNWLGYALGDFFHKLIWSPCQWRLVLLKSTLSSELESCELNLPA